VVLIYAFTQWLVALALVLANAELRFLWLALATAVLIGVVIGCSRSLSREQEQRDPWEPQGGASQAPANAELSGRADPRL
jgi:hypothetical protein